MVNVIENVKIFDFNREEYAAFDTVDNIMKRLQEMYPKESVYLQHPATGEVIDWYDFARARAVIEFITDYPFNVIPK